ncbi:MAG: Stp1/IreP family PP2C-type Ser/Thr phosphatase [Actinomycetota bacterium]|nr:Stp1/IreP family PP2C-type Ser/Thr phosphatase [Actinomycetota bacterium]
MNVGRHTGMTDTGRKRRRNEDSFVVDPPLFAVADGMGGANAGEIASGLAVEALRDEPKDESAGERFVVSLIQEANRRVYQRQTDDATASGMGTTMTVALIEDGVVRIGHVGDSRAYRFRDGELEQLTDDHSLVGELVRSGKISAQEAETHPQRSVITRALGTDPDVDVDTFTVDARPGDIFLLCSDGLYSMVGTEKILDVLERNRTDLDAAARELIRAANRRGGDDNITVVAFEIARPGEPGAAAAAPAAETDEVPPDEEDTLDESDRVPAVTTAVMSADEVQAASEEVAPPADPDEPREPRSRFGRRVALLLTLVAILAGVAVALYLLDVL